MPVIHKITDPESDIIAFSKLVDECKKNLSVVFPFTKQEIDFLEGVNTKGKIEPSLITDDVQLQARIEKHPMLLWKVMNVNIHRSGSMGNNITT